MAVLNCVYFGSIQYYVHIVFFQTLLTRLMDVVPKDLNLNRVVQYNPKLGIKVCRQYNNWPFIKTNPLKSEFTIVLFIHYKPRIAVTILDL